MGPIELGREVLNGLTPISPDPKYEHFRLRRVPNLVQLAAKRCRRHGGLQAEHVFALGDATSLQCTKACYAGKVRRSLLFEVPTDRLAWNGSSNRK